MNIENIQKCLHIIQCKKNKADNKNKEEEKISDKNEKLRKDEINLGAAPGLFSDSEVSSLKNIRKHIINDKNLENNGNNRKNTNIEKNKKIELYSSNDKKKYRPKIKNCTDFFSTFFRERKSHEKINLNTYKKYQKNKTKNKINTNAYNSQNKTNININNKKIQNIKRKYNKNN